MVFVVIRYNSEFIRNSLKIFHQFRFTFWKAGTPMCRHQQSALHLGLHTRQASSQLLQPVFPALLLPKQIDVHEHDHLSKIKAQQSQSTPGKQDVSAETRTDTTVTQWSNELHLWDDTWIPDALTQTCDLSEPHHPNLITRKHHTNPQREAFYAQLPISRSWNTEQPEEAGPAEPPGLNASGILEKDISGKAGKFKAVYFRVLIHVLRLYKLLTEEVEGKCELQTTSATFSLLGN